MKIKVKQLRALIREELSRILEAEQTDLSSIKDLVESEQLLKIADEINRMSGGKLKSDDVIKAYDKALTPEIRDAIKLALDNATAQQLSGLQHEAYLGEVDAMSGMFVPTIFNDPLDALFKLKEKALKNKDVRDVGVVALVLREMHDIMEDIISRSAPKGQARRPGLLGFMGL